MLYSFSIVGRIEAETKDDAMDILQLTIDDVASSTRITISNKDEMVVDKYET